MQKIPVLMNEIFNLYWNRNLQTRTPNIDVIKLFLMNARDRGDKLELYHVNSNFSACYNVNDLLTDCPS